MQGVCCFSLRNQRDFRQGIFSVSLCLFFCIKVDDRFGMVGAKPFTIKGVDEPIL
jgi:hypothetical protein